MFYLLHCALAVSAVKLPYLVGAGVERMGTGHSAAADPGTLA